MWSTTSVKGRKLYVYMYPNNPFMNGIDGSVGLKKAFMKTPQSIQIKLIDWKEWCIPEIIQSTEYIFIFFSSGFKKYLARAVLDEYANVLCLTTYKMISGGHCIFTKYLFI